MRVVAVILLACLWTGVDAWVTTTTTRQAFVLVSTKLFAEDSEKPEMMSQQADNPCWQDIYDDDCSMESMFSASFVASEWIKSMPCGEGIEDCDMPEPLQVPTARTDGVAETDVMDFLGLKRANKIDQEEGDVSP